MNLIVQLYFSISQEGIGTIPGYTIPILYSHLIRSKFGVNSRFREFTPNLLRIYSEFGIALYLLWAFAKPEN